MNKYGIIAVSWGLLAAAHGCPSLAQPRNASVTPSVPAEAGDTTLALPSPTPSPLPARAPNSGAQYYVDFNGASGPVVVGPLNKDDVIAGISEQTIKKTMLIWTQGMKEWTSVCQVDEFKSTCDHVALGDKDTNQLSINGRSFNTTGFADQQILGLGQEER